MKKIKNIFKRKERGITLIALVITIVVLLILAGISIAMLTGENGILTQAQRAKQENEKAEIIEQIQLDIADKQIENQGNISTEEFYEILEKYGNVSSDETILTTTKGNYEILISDIYTGNFKIDLVTTPIESWEYTISETNVILTKYIGTDEKIFIPNTFSINGISYTTILKETSSEQTGPNGPLAGNSILKEIKFDTNININKNSSWGIFNGCSNLEIIYSLPNINEGAYLFNNCSSLKRVPELPEGITNLDHTFYGCTSLVKAPSIPSTVTQMYATFKGCANLTGEIDIKSNNINNVYDCFANRNKQIYLKVNKNSTTFTTFDANIDTWTNIAFYGDTVYSIGCWGDSLTRGAGGDGTTYVSTLANKLKRYGNVTNLGVGGENTSTIAGRQGGIPMVVDSFTIPETTESVEITIKSKDGNSVKPALQDNNINIIQGLNPCYINNVEGRIEYSNGKYYFKRNVAGNAVNVNDGTEIITDGMKNYRDTDILIIWTGQNDNANINNISTIIEKQKKMIEYANTENYLVISLLYAGDDVNNKISDAYGEHFLDVRNALSTDNSNTVSDNYKSDGIHLNAEGYKIVGDQVYNKLVSLGYIIE